MEVILSNRVKSFTGSLGAGFGYSIRRRGNSFFAMRSPKGFVPMDGHWRFIKTCAQLAMINSHISDILVSAKELREALDECGLLYGCDLIHAEKSQIFHASQVMDFKKRWAL